MIAMNLAIAQRLSDLFDSIGFPEERGRNQRIATKFEVSRETVRKWLEGQALPETFRLAEMVALSPYTVDYILTGRQQMSQQQSYRVEEPGAPYNVMGHQLIARLSLALKGGHLDDKMIRVFNAILDTLMPNGR